MLLNYIQLMKTRHPSGGRTMRTGLVLLFACGLFVFRTMVPVKAEEPAPVEATTPAAAEPAASDAQPSIDYVETDIQAALRQLAARAGSNLIMGDEVVGKVTVHLEGVEYEDAMRLIAESKGYAYVKENNVVKVKSRESLETEPLELRVQTLNYAKAADIKGVIDAALTARGKTQVDARSNTIIITDTPANLTKLMPLIDILDMQTPQVLIEAKFVETTKNPKKDLGVNWSSTLLDHEVSATANQTDPVTGELVPGFSQIKNLAGGPWTPATMILNAGQVSVVFSYLMSDSDSELLANPRVVTTDNQKARISIATQFPIPSFTFSEQTASLQISGFEYKDIGIILNVLPRINKNDFVTLEVTPEASSSTENTTLQSGGGSSVLIPIINTRTATTTVLIKSGNTLAIGGLMRQDVSDNYTKVPIMGDIPGLGALFRSKSLSKTKRDLLIFLTPTIVQPDAQTGYEQYYNGLPKEEVYTNDKWKPQDNAKPKPHPLNQNPGTPDEADGPATKNFSPSN